jgi:hypothetical protein
MAHWAKRSWGVVAAGAIVVVAAACGSSGSNGAGAPDAAVEAGPSTVFTSCHDAPPAGFTPPALPTYAGTCPALALTPSDAGAAGVPPENDIMSSGSMRQFKLVTPSDLGPNEKVPVVFLWFWLGASAQDFISTADVIDAAQQQRFIAVVPEAKLNGSSSAYTFKWPFSAIDSQASLDQEFTFFDDMLACVEQQFTNNVNPSCVSSAGVSAGALFTDQLAPARSNVIASFLSLSGGVSGALPSCEDGLTCLKPWTKPVRTLPGLVLWGGMCDQCIVIDFEPASQNLETALVAENGFFVECEHNCEHAQPPFIAPPGMTQYAAFWDFVYAHPYWLPEGQSPYKANGLPSSFPAWCSTRGMGTAVERTGACGPPACPQISTTGPCASTMAEDSGAGDTGPGSGAGESGPAESGASD